MMWVALGVIDVVILVIAIWLAKLVFWDAERAQDAYRSRLEQHPMHAHDGQPCYGDCLRREDAA